MCCVNEMCYALIVSVFKFLIFIHFTNQITLEQSLQSFSYILRFFDDLPHFLFTTSDTMHNYYLETRVASRVAKRLKIQDLRKLGNIRKVSKPHRMITQCPSPPDRSGLPHIKTRAASNTPRMTAAQ